MLKVSLKFLFKTLFFLIPIFFIHISIIFLVYNFLWPVNILNSYVFNLIFSLAIYSGTYFFSLSNSSNSIVFYSLGTVFKFFMFYVFLYPKFIFDGEIQNLEFFTFFVPYLTCLIIEINQLLKFLNSRG